MKSEEIWPPPPTCFIEDTSSKPEGRPTGGLLLGIIGTGVLLSVILGAFTNAINAAVCPDYFYALVFNRMVAFSDICRASVIEGMQEAGVLGLFVSGAYALGACLICRSRLSYRAAAHSLLGVVAGTFLAWVVGGLLSVGFAALCPTLFAHAFDLPGGTYAWVGGSIDGGGAGSLLSLVVVLVRLYIRHRKTG